MGMRKPFLPWPAVFVVGCPAFRQRKYKEAGVRALCGRFRTALLLFYVKAHFPHPVIAHGFHDLRLGIHNEGSVLGNGCTQGFTAE